MHFQLHGWLFQNSSNTVYGTGIVVARTTGVCLLLHEYSPMNCRPRLATTIEAYGKAHHGGRLFLGGAKMFLDGSLGSRTALMWEPYSDAEPSGPDGAPSGTRMIDTEKLYNLVRGADAAGLQVSGQDMSQHLGVGNVEWYILARE